MAFLTGLIISVLYVLSVLFSRHSLGTYHSTLQYVKPTLFDVVLTFIPIFNLIIGLVFFVPIFKESDFASRYFNQKD